MHWLLDIVVGLVAALQGWLLILELFLWETVAGRRFSGLQPWETAASRKVARSMGLYDGFLGAGLVWGMALGPEGRAILLFFLSFVVIAGVFRAVSFTRRLLWYQAIPGAVALGVIWLV